MSLKLLTLVCPHVWQKLLSLVRKRCVSACLCLSLVKPNERMMRKGDSAPPPSRCFTLGNSCASNIDGLSSKRQNGNKRWSIDSHEAGKMDCDGDGTQ